MITTPNLGLVVWNLTSDPYNHDELAENWAKLDQHDHTVGKGARITTGAIADGAVTSAKLATGAIPTLTVEDGTITTNKLAGAAVTTAKINDGAVTAAKLAAGLTLPPGIFMPFGASSVPSGWLLCDGTAVSRATYADLFTVVGTTWGSGDGSSTFNVPNLKGRVPVGRDAAQTEFDVLAETGGNKTQTTSTGSTQVGADSGILGVNINTHTHTVSSLQPYAVVNSIIKT